MKNTLRSLLLLIIIGMTFSGMRSQTLTFEETKQLLDKTMQGETLFNEEVILFIVTMDTSYYHKAKSNLLQLRDNYIKLKDNGDKKITQKYALYYFNGETNIGLNYQVNFKFNTFWVETSKDTEKANKEVVFKEKTYTISKKRKVEFDEYFAQWERSVNDYKKFQEIKW